MFKSNSITPAYIFFLIPTVILLHACSFSEKTSQRYYEKASTKSYDMIAVPGVPFTEAGWDSTMIKALQKILCFQVRR
jgi:ABC-type spermidine/putrescine transport system permease subunit II